MLVRRGAYGDSHPTLAGEWMFLEERRWLAMKKRPCFLVVTGSALSMPFFFSGPLGLGHREATWGTCSPELGSKLRAWRWGAGGVGG